MNPGPDMTARPSGGASRRCAVVLLAAGGSVRFGSPKQLALFGGTSLLRHAAGTALAARIGPVVVVLGAESEACAKELVDQPVDVAINPAWPEGMGASVRFGVAAAEQRHPGVASVLVMTVDQPRVPPGVLRALAEAVVTGAGSVAACGYAGAVGVPAAFARRHFPALLAMKGDRGARSLLLAHAASMVVVPCAEAAVDVDTPGDL